MAQEIVAMSIKKLFSTIIALLFSHRQFWEDYRSGKAGVVDNVLKDYAVPVIALVQLVKFPLIGIPRQAMIIAIATFLVDVAALYLITGGIMRFFEGERQNRQEQIITAVIGFSLTPVWLAEPFYFLGNWSWVFASAAILFSLFISNNGFSLLFDRTNQSAMRNSALLLVTVCLAVFVVERGMLRLFNGFSL